MLGSPRLVFDPGIHGLDQTDPEDLDVLELVSDFFEIQFPGHLGKCPVVTSGDILLDRENFEQLDSVLFDSGAMQASYISKQWIDQHRELLGKRIRACRGRVRMADNKTVVDVHERFRTMIKFEVRATGEVIAGVVDFWVLDMPGPDSITAIVGLPDILKSFLRVFDGQGRNIFSGQVLA